MSEFEAKSETLVFLKAHSFWCRRGHGASALYTFLVGQEVIVLGMPWLVVGSLVAQLCPILLLPHGL